MGFKLTEIVPWGRSYTEYVDMFALTKTDVTKKILGCGDGPASFNALLTKTGGKVISVDPLYEFSQDAIAVRIKETFAVVIEQVRLNQQEFVWNKITSVEALGNIRLSAMEAFLADYPEGVKAGRYQQMRLPVLAFPEQYFALALCSHLLFLYSEQLSESFHLAAIKELCRVSAEVRIFPLLELDGQLSRHLPAVLQQLTADGYLTQLSTVAYEFQKGGNQMLMVKQM
ncbi:MAG: SAM-dependent methyltransferase [Methylococcaceae bacterium]|nr:SAM-dependent methyltransferase [Methylococcaceae bacterium]